MADRIDNGDEKLDKAGRKVRLRMSGKDMMLVNAMLFDKRQLLRKEPNTISEKVITVQDRNQILANQFRKMGHAGVKVLEGEFTEEIEDNGNV